MSNWPPPVATSEVTFCRSVFSGNVTYFTLMPYLLVNLEVSDCITIMSGLFTVAIVRVGWPFVCAAPTPTSTARLTTITPHRPTAKRDTRMLLPSSGCDVTPTVGRARRVVESPTRLRDDGYHPPSGGQETTPADF